MGARRDKNSTAFSKRIQGHAFDDEEGDEYGASSFGGFGEYMRRKKTKLQNLDAELRKNSTKPQIFRGVVVHINGYTQPSLHELHRLIVSHGGGFVQYLDGKTIVTHIIASNLTPKKKVEFRKYRVVQPQWIVESINQGKQLPWHDFRVVDEGQGQKVLGFQDGAIVSAVNTLQKGYRGQSDASWYTKQLHDGERNRGASLDEHSARQSEVSSNRASPVSSADEPAVSPGFSTGGIGSSKRDPSVGPSAPLPAVGNQFLPNEQYTFGSPTEPSSSIEEMRVRQRQQEILLSTPLKPPALQMDAVMISPLTREGLRASSYQSALSPQLTPLAQRGYPASSPLSAAAARVLSQVSSPDDLLNNPQSPEPGPIASDLVIPRPSQPTIETVTALPARIIDRSSSGPELKADPNGEDYGLVFADDETEYGSLPSHPYKRRASSEADREGNKKPKLTAEEHNERLLSDPHIWKSSTMNPDFMKMYFSESRLHHLSSWKASLKAEMQALAAETSSQRARRPHPTKTKPGTRRYIVHADFDCFFVAVSLKNSPDLANQPSVVAHGSGPNSEVASCNYKAREFGVKNGMWMKTALKHCKDLKVLPYDFPAYETVSRQFYDAVLSIGGIVESISVDEALIDISEPCKAVGSHGGHGMNEGSIWREQERAEQISQSLRDKVKEQTGCTISVGIGNNILQAKVALRRAKPAGQYLLKPEDVLDMIGELEVEQLPGIAWSIGGKLENLGAKFVKDIRGLSKEKLMGELGPKTGEKVWDFARGIDRTLVAEQSARKSVSVDINWGVRFTKMEQTEDFVRKMSGELERRMVAAEVKGTHLTMKIMRRAMDAPMMPPKHLGHGKCDAFSKSSTFGIATYSAEDIGREAVVLLRQHRFSPGELRGITLQMQRLDPVKPVAATLQDTGQKRLHFTRSAANQTVSRVVVQDSDPSFQLPNSEPVAERKPDPSKSSIVFGSQLVIPSQIDPAILSELPADIRAKLEQGIKRRAQQDSIPSIPGSPKPEPPITRQRPNLDSRPASLPAARNQSSLFPAQSQLDPAVLDELPSELRAEILADYEAQKHRKAAQSLLPQSPRKDCTLRAKPLSTRSPAKRKTLLAKATAHAKGTGSRSTLTQANFVDIRPRSGGHDGRNSPADDSDACAAPDPDFLASLPEDIRREVLEDHRRQRLRRTAGIDIRTRRRQERKRSVRTEGEFLRLPARPSKPVFGPASHGVSEISDLRRIVREWFEDTKDEPEGPHPDDVKDLVLYLRKVMLEERDLEKASLVVVWVRYLCEQAVAKGTRGAKAWQGAEIRLHDALQAAAAERGLGTIAL